MGEGVVSICDADALLKTSAWLGPRAQHSKALGLPVIGARNETNIQALFEITRRFACWCCLKYIGLMGVKKKAGGVLKHASVAR